MVLALSLIFFGVKRLRDRELGGVIRFIPALLAGLGISAVAGVIYVIGWEITLAVTDFAFIDSYSTAAVEAARAKGASPAEIEAVICRWTSSAGSMRTRCSGCRSRSSRSFRSAC